MDDRLLDELKFIGQWISRETNKRKYPKEEIETLSSALIYLRKNIMSLKASNIDKE